MNRLLRSAIALPLLVFGSVGLWASSKEDQFFPLTNFSGGLDSNYSSLTIADNEVHDALNVYFTKDNAVSKRKGFTLYGSTTAVAFQGGWQYIDSNNIIWIVVRSSDAIRGSPGNGSFTVRVATCPTPQVSNVSAVNAFGKIYFVDNISGVYSWDGTTLQYISGSPKGTFITEFHGRLWVGGLSIPNQNYLYGSAYLDGSNWTTGTLATDPVLYQVGLNDRSDGLTGFWSGYNDTLYIFKNQSINALYGFDQTDFQLRVLSKEAGCIDSGSIQAWKGYLIFMSQRGLEQFDGYIPVRISNKIKDKIDASTTGSLNQRSFLGTGSAFFNSGTISPSTGAFVSNNGQLQLSTGSVQVTLGYPTAGPYALHGNTSVWYGYYAAQSITSTATFNLAGVVIPLDKFGTGWTWYVNFLSDNAGIPGTILSSTTLDVASIPAVLGPTNNIYVPLPNAISVSSGTRYWVQLQPTSALPPCPCFNYLEWYASLNSFGEKFYVGITSYTDFTQSIQLVGQTHPAVATWSSPAINIGTNINSWSSFQTTQNLTNGGSISYSICTSSSSTLYPKTCVSQLTNTQITNSTNTYVQVIATFTATANPQNPTLSNFTINWNEGVARPKMSSIIYDNRYWVALATSTADTANTAIVVLSQDNSGSPVFTIWDIAAGALLLYKHYPYHADANPNGKVYQDDIGYNDNGNPINAYFQTKDYAPGSLLQDKYFEGLYVYADSLGSYNLSTSYMIDRNPSLSFSLSDINQSEQTGMINAYLPFPFDSSHQKFGKIISFRFSNTSVDQPFNVYGGTLQYRNRNSLGNLNAQ